MASIVHYSAYFCGFIALKMVFFLSKSEFIIDKEHYNTVPANFIGI